MTEYNLTFLTTQEAEQINNWLTENSCDLSKGYIILSFEYWIFGTGVVLKYINADEKLMIEIREDEVEMTQEKTVTTLTIGDLSIPLTLSTAALNIFLTLARQETAAHFAEECEPPGFSLFFQINQTGYRLFAGLSFAGSREIPYDSVMS